MLETDGRRMCSVSCSYISTNVNSVSGCMDWGQNDNICFGSSCSVYLYCPNGGADSGIFGSLNKHKNNVEAVRWIRNSSPEKETELVSASADTTCIVWSISQGILEAKQTLKGHLMTVNAVDALSFKNSGGMVSTLITSASADSTIKFWRRESLKGEFLCTDTVDLGQSLCLVLKLMAIPECTDPVLVAGLSNFLICIYSGSVKLLSLSGHEDWVRCLAITTNSLGDCMLASGSQDSTIRLWRLSHGKGEESEGFNRKDLQLEVEHVKYRVSLESVLMGHEGWVTGLYWSNNSRGECLASCSIDRTILMWRPDPESGVWLEQARLGELGGNTLGYLGICLSPDSSRLLSYSYQGAIHLWVQKSENVWKSTCCAGGHFDSVEDIVWEKDKGRYLLSCSSDQTTRLHAPWRLHPEEKGIWFELGRPQVHGHAMSSLAALPCHSFVSGSEEKVVRAFVAPDNMLSNLSTLTGTISEEERRMQSGPLGASVPSLGLSNKAVFTSDAPSSERDQYSDGHFTPLQLTEPPTEENLVQNTLWPEVIKLYGHGYEIFSLAASNDGKLVASACKAAKPEYAAIILWDTGSWEQVTLLYGHTLTVTQMAFSPDDSALLSVSRDRTWCLFNKNTQGEWNLRKKSDKTSPHGRIIWSCDWSHDSLVFVTVSRDGKAVCWNSDLQPSTFSSPSALTAVALPRQPVPSLHDKYLVAIGSELGDISLYSWSSDWKPLATVPSNFCHHLCVKRLRFRPVSGTAESTAQDPNTLQLASCSQDRSVRVFSISL